MGFQDSTAGTGLSEAYLDEEAKQSVMKYASAAARTADAALTAVLREGMVSSLDDSDMLYFYNGSSWISPARGAVAAPAQVNTSQAGTSASPTDIASTTVSWTAVSARRYKATASFTVSSSAGGLVTCYLTDAGNTVYDQGGSTSSGNVKMTLVAYITGATGSVSMKLRYSVASGTATFNPGNTSATPTLLIVEDIGA